MGLFSSTTKSRSAGTRVLKVKPPTPQERQLLRHEVGLAAHQLGSLKRLDNFNIETLGRFRKEMAVQGQLDPRFAKMQGQALSAIQPSINYQDDLSKRAMANIARGVQLSPDQEALIASSADNAIAAGLSDLSAFRDESMRSLAQETSQARGLRPEDTPILDVGGRIANESSRQASQLINNVRAQESQQRLEYPIQAGNFVAGQIAQQQQQGNTSIAFLNQMRQDAFTNRLNLLAQTNTMLNQNASFAPNPSTFGVLSNIRMQTGRQEFETNSKGKGSPSLFDNIMNVADAVGGFTAP